MGDALKLFSKAVIVPYKSLLFPLILGPVLGFWLMAILWMLVPPHQLGVDAKWSVLLLLVLIRVGVYPLILRGWGSNCKYSIIGAIRGIAQTISYEIRLSLLLFSFLAWYWTTSLKTLAIMTSDIAVSGLILCWLPLWVLSCVAETNRTPFDFREGESELVSGFNTEYGGAGFALIFMAEYGIILLFRYFTRVILLGLSPLKGGGGFLVLFLAFFWVWLRRTFPRYRYDKLISLCWKAVLPFTLLMLCYRSWLTLL